MQHPTARVAKRLFPFVISHPKSTPAATPFPAARATWNIRSFPSATTAAAVRPTTCRCMSHATSNSQSTTISTTSTSTTTSTPSPSNSNTSITLYRTEVLKHLFNTLKNAGDHSKHTLLSDKHGIRINEISVDQFITALVQLFDVAKVPISTFNQTVANLSPLEYQNDLRCDLSPDAIAGLTDELISESRHRYDTVAATIHTNPTFANTLGLLSEDDRLMATLGSSISFPSQVSADPAIRAASTTAKTRLSAYAVEASMRVDVYQAIVKFAETAEAKELTGESGRLLSRKLRDYRRAGMHLDAEKRAEIQRIRQDMSKISIAFSQNLAEITTQFEFTKAELKGLSDDALKAFKQTRDGKYIVTLKYPDYLPAMDCISVESTRRTLERAFNTRGMKNMGHTSRKSDDSAPTTVETACGMVDITDNVAILEKLVELRAKQASILGFKDHASFVLDIRMAQSPTKVIDFLTDLSRKLDPLVDHEMKELLALKEAEKKEAGEPFDGKIHMYDFRYYLHKQEMIKYQIDQEEVRRYFPLDIVTKGLFDIYQTLLGVRFQQVPPSKAHVWHPDVTLYDVVDEKSNQTVAQFYMDLHPRDGKYGHAACFSLINACKIGGTEHRQLPVAAMVANFSSPTADKPSLLQHKEVVTYFHEFGHVMHQCLSTTEHNQFSGTKVETDFVEAPSQMLENWCWEKESLLRMSGHWQDPSKKLPDTLLDKLVAAKNANSGLLNKRQILFGLFDQWLHSRPTASTSELLYETFAKVWPIPMTPETNFSASFAHITGGYDSGYYSYMWSEVYSADMFDRFHREGILNPVTGAAYRNEILAKGGSQDAMDLIRVFLGRDPQMEPFLISKGLSSATA